MFAKAIQRPELLFLTLLVITGAPAGCSSPAPANRFQEVPPAMLGQTNPPLKIIPFQLVAPKTNAAPQPVPTMTNPAPQPVPPTANAVPQPAPPSATVHPQPAPPPDTADLQIMGYRSGVTKVALVKGIKVALGPPSPAYPEQAQMSDAVKLADRVVAGEKVTLTLPADMAKEITRSLERAGLIIRLSE